MIVLEHGERYGKLTVLRRTPSRKYICGCACGFSGSKVSARKLMRGEVTACKRCSVSASANTIHQQIQRG